MAEFDRSQIDAINAEASVLMKEGIRLLEMGPVETLPEALIYFDRALELRRRLPTDEEPILGFGLAACWLNRADALARLGSPAQLREALTAYDEGIKVLLKLPFEQDARFPRRLALAHQNRAMALLAVGHHRVGDAIAALTEAVAVLERKASAAIPDRAYVQATIWANLAKAHASASGPDVWGAAANAAHKAIALIGGDESRSVEAAEVGLNARHVLCQALAERLSLTSPTGFARQEDVHEATDLVDEALGLARAWERKGVARFRAIAHDVFRFGARLYAKYQPQFLTEFVDENMDPERSSAAYVESAEMQSAAEEARRSLRPS